MDEGKLWSWVRSVMSQGADIRCDYDQGVHKGYEAYSARLDAAAAERAQELAGLLKGAPRSPMDVAKAAFAEMQRKDAERIAALPPGTCEQCEGAGGLGGQFCGGQEWTCEACGGTGKAPNENSTAHPAA